MRTGIYESAVLINAALDDQQIESILTRIKDVITNNGGEIRELDNWGRKRLAYPVEKSKIGYYAIYRFEAPSDMIAKLERIYSLDEQILRYVTLKLNGDAVEQLEKNKALSSTIKDEIVTEVVEVIASTDEEADTSTNNEEK
ncbi:MAG: 30S ribosomal protein S6 [Ignavibacteriaceae bacterium]|nr:30S ribosomal protein S6 [Ignavibacterium sp.]MCC6255068.1 30S ribosomal protein S6 [Ignavibacteriaceae bacterium]HMN23614.1 30S ribosomal protein S6 [Ignavibacteriaceae bacterium]HRN26342.1 30S ribosomal protein S6 [Ignavibacteriaceae bacterium]HRP92138.1 30S ribosomal protein S6 [Ignavibacteriaceae bacterium]